MPRKSTKPNGAPDAKSKAPSAKPTEASPKGKAAAKPGRVSPVASPLTVAELAEKVIEFLEKYDGATVLFGDIERHLQEEHRASPMSIVSAISLLEDDGRIECRSSNKGRVVTLVEEDEDEDEDGDDDEDEDRDEDIETGKTENHKHVLTPAEIEEERKKREAEDVLIEQLLGELKAAKGEVKAKQKEVDALLKRGRERAKVCRDGFRMMQIRVEERREFDKRPGIPPNTLAMVTYRLDTNEAIRWREPTMKERQEHLFDRAAPTPSKTEIREPA
jgi:hypothetical protein